MKLLLSLFLLFSALTAGAQNTTWKFRVTESLTDGSKTTTDVLICTANRQALLQYAVETDTMLLYIDSIRRRITFIEDFGGDPAVFHLEFDQLTLADLLPKLLPDSIGYELLPEWKTITGISCQSLFLVKGGRTVGSGWITLDKAVPLLQTLFINGEQIGSLLEFELNDDGKTTRWELVSFDDAATFPEHFFAPDLTKVKGHIVTD